VTLRLRRRLISRWTLIACLCCVLSPFSIPLIRSQAAASASHTAANTFVEFTDVAAKAGLTAVTQDGGETSKKYILETTGSGAAFVDYDNDGWPDVFLVNGSTLEQGSSAGIATSHLYHNNHDGTFSDVTQKAGVGLSGWGQGVCAGDYDNDGWTDLFVTFWGHNVLLHNNGNGTFSDATKQMGLSSDRGQWSTGCSFVDYDRDGILDLFVAHYVDLDLEHTHAPGSRETCKWKEIPVMCGPRGLKGTQNSLYKGVKGSPFVDVSTASHIDKTAPGYCFTSIAADFNNNGWPDIFVACDSTPSLYFHNNQNGTFTEQAGLVGVAYTGDGREQAGMGADVGDYDGDGWLDIVRTNFSDDTTTLYHNNHDGSFTDTSLEAGLGSNIQYLGWGVLFVDVDNDQWPDLLIANGHVYPEVDRGKLGSTFRERKILYLNQHDGRFRDISANAGPAILKAMNSHGLAAADVNNDGSVELLINNSHDPPSLLRNIAPQQNWILLKLIGTVSNRSAIGARVAVRIGSHTQEQEVRSGSGYISQSDFRLHFGTGSATSVDSIEVRWPSGTVQRMENTPANQIVVITEKSKDAPPQK
jgi:hypothetical protein